MLPKVAAIVVSHNSEATLERCLQGLLAQNYCLESIILVDSGSRDRSYLKKLRERYSIQLIFAANIGFSQANNLGYGKLSSAMDFVVFVNPDLFLPPDCITKALDVYDDNTEIGILSGKLLGYDLEHDKPSGRIDSTGIMRKWYGRWYDRGQGEVENSEDKRFNKPECMPALCGALLFCRNKALTPFANEVFDPDFFLYKEDIELCLRLRKAGWKILYHPELQAFHCRGWKSERAAMSHRLRITAAKSEVLLYKKHPSPYVVWALLKFFLVSVVRL